MKKKIVTIFLTGIVVLSAAVMSFASIASDETVVVSDGENEESEGADEQDTTPEKKKVSLAKAKITSVVAKENGTIVLKWNKVKKATAYEVFRSKKKSSGYKKLIKTKKLKYTDKKAKAGTVYYYKVRAVSKETKNALAGCGKYSAVKSKLARKKPKRIAFLGDSVMSGFAGYGVMSDSREKSFAKVSLRVSGLNRDVLPSVLSYDPDRVYIMIGTNDVVGNPSTSVMKSYLEPYYTILKRLHSNNKACEVIVMGIGPTRGSGKITNSTVKRFNGQLKKIAKKYDYAMYYDTGEVLRDDGGQLKSEYTGYDGIHWSKAAYDAVYSSLHKFVKKW